MDLSQAQPEGQESADVGLLDGKKGRAGADLSTPVPKVKLRVLLLPALLNVRIGLEIQTTGMPGRRLAIRNSCKLGPDYPGIALRELALESANSFPAPFTPMGLASQLSQSITEYKLTFFWMSPSRTKSIRRTSTETH